jgi:hypothetical protein
MLKIQKERFRSIFHKLFLNRILYEKLCQIGAKSALFNKLLSLFFIIIILITLFLLLYSYYFIIITLLLLLNMI